MGIIRARFVQTLEDYRRQGGNDLEEIFLGSDEWREIIQICIADEAMSVLLGEKLEVNFIESHMAKKIINMLAQKAPEERVKILGELDVWVSRILRNVFMNRGFILDRLNISVILGIVREGLQ